MHIGLTKNWEIGIERTSSSSMYIRLPHNGSIWIERSSEAYTTLFRPDAVKDDGSCFVWWGRLHVIFTPPGWRHPRSLKPVEVAD